MKILVISKGIFHPTVFCRRALRKVLAGYGDTSYSNNIESLGDLCTGETDAVLLYFHEKQINRENLTDLVRFVDEGGKLLCIHGALASFKEFPGYNALTGSRFTGHGKIREMNITGVMDFAVCDEPYEFELSDDCTLLLEDGGLPVSWIRKQGRGKVAGFVPGHRYKTVKSPYFINMIQYILDERF